MSIDQSLQEAASTLDHTENNTAIFRVFPRGAFSLFGRVTSAIFLSKSKLINNQELTAFTYQVVSINTFFAGATRVVRYGAHFVSPRPKTFRTPGMQTPVTVNNKIRSRSACQELFSRETFNASFDLPED